MDPHTWPNMAFNSEIYTIIHGRWMLQLVATRGHNSYKSRKWSQLASKEIDILPANLSIFNFRALEWKIRGLNGSRQMNDCPYWVYSWREQKFNFELNSQFDDALVLRSHRGFSYIVNTKVDILSRCMTNYNT